MNLILSGGLSAQNVADLVMGFSGVVSGLFLIVVLFFGGYGLNGVLRLRRERSLFPNRLMYPNYCPYDECMDPDGYIEYIMPRLTVLSCTMLLSGLVLLLGYFIPTMRSLGISLMVYIVPFVIYVWYSACLKKAIKKFWE